MKKGWRRKKQKRCEDKEEPHEEEKLGKEALGAGKKESGEKRGKLKEGGNKYSPCRRRKIGNVCTKLWLTKINIRLTIYHDLWGN